MCNALHKHTHLLPNLCHVSPWEDLQVRLQGTRLDRLAIQHPSHVLAKENVVLQGSVLDPCLLRNVGNTTLCGQREMGGGSEVIR